MFKVITISLMVCSFPFWAQGQQDSATIASARSVESLMRVIARHQAQHPYVTPPALQDEPDAMQPEVYRINKAVDIPIAAVGAAWSLYAFTKIYSKDPSSLQDIQNLNADDLNSFDRWAAGNSSESADVASNYFFYGSMPLPLVLFADKHMRQDAFKITFLYLEAMAITGLFYTGSTYFIDRYRPEAYNTSIPAEDRLSGNLRNSFPAGHVALVATSTFFTAKVFNDYHPESRLKWVMYGGAAAATAATIYLRHKAGKHFPSDVVLGTTFGTLTGILVPHLHKNKPLEDRGFSIAPSFREDAYGVSLTYRFK